MKSASKPLLVVSLLAFLALGVVTPGLAQDQLNLADGLNSVHFNGAGTTHISMLIPAPYCSGGTCISRKALPTARGICNRAEPTRFRPRHWLRSQRLSGPLYLTVNADGSSTVTQTEQIAFSYTSPQGTLTGLLDFTSVSATNNNLKSTWWVRSP